ncbi:MAG: MFS transporter [Acidimicrobiales bacterium]
MLVASCGFVIVLDNFAAAVAFPRILAAFPDTAPTTLAWASTGYAIALAALLLVAGKLSDRYGMRRVYLMGMAGFVVGALASAAAPNPGLLIAARVVQGSSGAFMVSTSIALALLGYSTERRGAAMGAIGILGSIASMSGPVLAGNIIRYGGSWRWVFLVSVPIGLVTLAVGPKLLPEGRSAAPGSQSVDLWGVVLVVVASGLLTLGLLQSRVWGWASGWTVGSVVIAVVAGGLFWRRCQRIEQPLLRFAIFSRPTFLVATLSQMGSQLAIFAFFFWVPLFLTGVWDWQASSIGWVTTVPLLLSCVSLPIGRWADRHGYRNILVVGGLLGTASMIWPLMLLDGQRRFWVAFLPCLLLFGLAIGMVGITAASAALAGLSNQDLAAANSAFQTSRRQVQTLGVAVVVGLLGPGTSPSAYRVVWIVCAVCFAVSSVVALWYPDVRRAPAGSTMGTPAAGSSRPPR